MLRTRTPHRLSQLRRTRQALCCCASLCLWAPWAHATSLLFIGNSFTYGAGSAVHFYRADTVVDLNHQGVGGVPALFKSFATQAGLTYEVFLETQGGAGLDWHLAHKRQVLGQRAWDMVVAHGYSTLDASQPGNPSLLVASAKALADALRMQNPNVALHLSATWSRADQTYPAHSPWYGKPIEAMARDVRAGYDLAAATSPVIKSVIPVGEAFNRAMQTGVADPNPYDGIAANQINLWTHDHYHASSYGYYLSALVVFGALTGKDPRSLGELECSGYELGMSAQQVRALQQVAFDELASTGRVTAAPRQLTPSDAPRRCAPAR